MNESILKFSGTWERKVYAVWGGWFIIQRNGQSFLEIHEDFDTSDRPDLKIFLTEDELHHMHNRQDVSTSAYSFGLLKKHIGVSTYCIPLDCDLQRMHSVVFTVKNLKWYG